MKRFFLSRRRGTVLFLGISVVVVAAFLYVSSLLVDDLSHQERARMQIWADATKEIADMGSEDYDEGSGIDFLLRIIEGNTNIPVLLTDDGGNILMHRNFRLPEPVDSMAPLVISPANKEYLRHKLEKMRRTSNVIDINIGADAVQHLYYEDSTLLRNLSLFPYIQLGVMAAFVVVVYFAVTSSKRAEQNKVWVGLSKETAHQLGTPISSLMAWLQLLEAEGVDAETVREMDKDVKRLETIASRFSKIGSRPKMEPADLNAVVEGSAGYMATRISHNVKLRTHIHPGAIEVNMSAPLVEWVMENLIKNAVDAMEGRGDLTITTDCADGIASVEVTDTGRGMARKDFDTVFRPGYTTKKRGWGLGLTLARRIVEQYHGGKIFVKSSEPGRGTTFRMEFHRNV
ncbi:MAG: ATP-binding protein [Muribaculaceae bacterium]|nr:ATP-binding protein [Muribaculaceae bacterium]